MGEQTMPLETMMAPRGRPDLGSDQELPIRSRYFWEALGVFWCALVLSWTAGAWLQMKNLAVGLTLTEVLFFAFPALLFIWRHRASLEPAPFARPPVRILPWAILMAACIACIAVAKGVGVRRSLGLSVPDAGLSLSVMLSLVVLAPLCEELVMRPVLQRAFSLYWRPRTAVMATALLFALLHASWLRFGETFILGLFCGILFLKTGNYWASVLLHAVANAMGPVLFKYASSGRIDWLLNPITTVALSVVALVAVWQVTSRSLVPLTGVRQRMKWLFFGGGGETVQLAKTRGMAVAYWIGAGLLMLGLSAALTAEMNLFPRDVLENGGRNGGVRHGTDFLYAGAQGN